MASDENLYKRLEDHEWRKNTDTRLTLLTQGEIVQNDRLDAIQDHLEQLDQLLEGDPLDKKDNGLKGDIVDLNRGLNELRAILQPDALGNGGFRKRLEKVEQALGLTEKRIENRWTFATKVVAATISAIALVAVALLSVPGVRNAIGHYLESRFSTPSSRPSSKTVLKRSGSKGRHARRPAVRAEIPAPQEANDEPANENAPE